MFWEVKNPKFFPAPAAPDAYFWRLRRQFCFCWKHLRWSILAAKSCFLSDIDHTHVNLDLQIWACICTPNCLSACVAVSVCLCALVRVCARVCACVRRLRRLRRHSGACGAAFWPLRRLRRRQYPACGACGATYL